MLWSLEQSFISFCRKVGLLYELTYPYGLGDHPNEYNRNYIKQYEYLYNLLGGILSDAARSGNPVQEREVNQPTPLGAEDFRHHVRLTVEDASFYLLVQCFRTEPVEAYIFHTEMSFRVPKKFWGDDDKYSEILSEIHLFFNNNFPTSYPREISASVMDNLDIEETVEDEDLNEWWSRVSSEAPVKEGTERERWWE